VEPSVVGMNPTLLQAADRAILSALDAGAFSAAALVVGRRGGLVRMRGYGTTADGSPVDPNSTIFDLASLTKVVATASAVATLVDRGEMELAAPVRRYVPEFGGGEKDQVTIWHLLTHTSGLPPGLALFGSASSPEQALEQVIDQPLRRSPDVQVEYSDLGMILLAEAIERAAGKPLDQLLIQRVFAPLGMESTTYLPPLAFQAGIVPTAIQSERPFTLQGVVHDGNAFRLGGVTGHAGLFSTPADLAVFAQTMLNGGSYGEVQIFADTTVQRFTARQPGAGSRALGWDTPDGRSSAGRFLSSRTFGHTGYTGTSIWIDPEKDLFVILLSNRTYTRATTATMLNVRIAVHEAVARAIADQPVVARVGAR
jgi:CubicO group peptidase (beta-lactamase class C family)